MSIISSLLNCSKEERIKAFNLLINHPDTEPLFEAKVTAIVEKILNNSFDAHLATSELKPIKRIATVETVLGLNDMVDFEDEDRELTIPEKIDALKEEIRHIEFRAPISPQVELKPDTKTGMRALHLITRLRDSGKQHLTHKEIKSILTSDLPEDCKIDAKCKNPRKTIIDVLNEAIDLCSDVFLDQKKKGHKEWRIVLKS